jgi:hypothetical protein
MEFNNRVRRILVSYARRHNSSKRGGGKTPVAFDESIALPARRDLDVLALDGALERPSQIDPQQGRIVELRMERKRFRSVEARKMGCAITHQQATVVVQRTGLQPAGSL